MLEFSFLNSQAMERQTHPPRGFCENQLFPPRESASTRKGLYVIHERSVKLLSMLCSCTLRSSGSTRRVRPSRRPDGIGQLPREVISLVGALARAYACAVH